MDLNILKKSRTVHLCFAMIFFTSGIIVNLIQAVFYFGLKPFNKTLYRKINWYLCYTIYCQVVCLAERWANTNLLFYIDKKEWDTYYGKEHGYSIMNHRYEIDWVMGLMMVPEKITVLGNCKAYAKNAIQHLPILGWAFKFAEFVFLERSYEKDIAVINQQIKELGDHPDPIWLILFPEGTRFTPKKHQISLDFAHKNNLPVLKHHLLPRTKGFIASLPSMRGKIGAIYDTLVVFKEDDPAPPTIKSLLFGKTMTAHIYINRIALEEVPATEPEQKEFLRQLFVKKDIMKDSFIQTGDFFKNSGVAPVEPWLAERRIWPVLNVWFWMVSILIPLLYYLVKLFFSGQIICFIIGAGLILTFYVLLQRIIAVTETKSSYGAKSEAKSD